MGRDSNTRIHWLANELSFSTVAQNFFATKRRNSTRRRADVRRVKSSIPEGVQRCENLCKHSFSNYGSPALSLNPSAPRK